MTEASTTFQDLATLAALANGIIPADERDAGAATVHAGAVIAERLQRGPSPGVYVAGLQTAHEIARALFDQRVAELNAGQVHALLTALAAQSPAFFRQLRADVCALYLSDAGVWQRIGFPGPSTANGGYPDFDRPQT